jgi:RimJ/RimL family protein N-acetyltransferase
LTDPRQLQYALAQFARDIERWRPAFNAAWQEPYFLDDELRGYDPLQLLMRNFDQSELFVCMHGEHLVGFAYISGIDGRSGNLEAWVNPDYRTDYRHRKVVSTLAHEILDYVFKPAGQLSAGGGLGLAKLKTRIAASNRASLRAAQALGFKPIGVSPLEGFYNSSPTDIVLLEMFNPAFSAGEEAPNGRKPRTKSTDVHGAPAVQPASVLRKPRTVSGATTNKHSKRANANAGNEPGRKRRVNAAKLAAAKPKSNESERAAEV